MYQPELQEWHDLSEKVVSHWIAQAWLCEAQALWLVAECPQKAVMGSQTKGLKVECPGKAAQCLQVSLGLWPWCTVG